MEKRKNRNLLIKRRPLQGVLHILSFNRHFYVGGLLALVLMVCAARLFHWPPGLYYGLLGAWLYGLCMPLLVSAYVYDFSGYYRFDWLKAMQVEDSPDSFHVNIHAGFDETSHSLAHLFPRARLQVYDFYNPLQHTEAAIVRARKVSSHYPHTQAISTAAIPLPDHSVDHIFFLSALHEVREHAEKVQFLQECRRVCKAKGKVIMVEHLRDFPNFLAFSIGFTHFFSRKTWKKAFREAGFPCCEEKKFTPFMSVFCFS